MRNQLRAEATYKGLLNLKMGLEENKGDIGYFFENCVSEAELLMLINGAMACAYEIKSDGMQLQQEKNTTAKGGAPRNEQYATA